MAVERANLQDQIKVSTALYMADLADTYPPSRYVFNSTVQPFMRQIVNFLVQNQSPLLANVYPIFAYSSSLNNWNDPKSESALLEYALFISSTNEVGFDATMLLKRRVGALWVLFRKVVGQTQVIPFQLQKMLKHTTQTSFNM
ncbi:PREDICTED: glucan endo-1,3-beta-glucosidase-like [Nelumbo nucifera]|uniref:Glucan endo-1,3-beta-glucosidase-like n=1 Tax=Nelumbo nucifera TaxID=4432 RepID=A0A1U8AYJ0_NELNU|nr:PREDICTED: glucan endo-1,3-beta-glucosidase-like [Nelumbo nucifera]